MATIVDLEVPATRLGLEETFDRVPALEVQFAGTVGDAPPLAWISGADREVVESVLARDGSVEVHAAFDVGAEGRWLYRLSFGHGYSTFQDLVVAHGGTIFEATARARGWSVTVLFHEQRAVSRCHELLESHEYRPEVTRLRTKRGGVDAPTPLTDVQYETISKAHELGYFEVPRSVTLEELASELGVSHQALSERLRRSHAALVNAALAGRPSPIGIDS